MRAGRLAVGTRRAGVVGFVPADLTEPAATAGRTRPPVPAPAFAPPRIDLDRLPTRVAAPKIALAGRARADGGVTDVYVLSRSLHGTRWEVKRGYRAAPAGQRAPAELAYRFEIPVAEGGNRIEIVARSAGGVVGRRWFWVYRGAAPDPLEP